MAQLYNEFKLAKLMAAKLAQLHISARKANESQVGQATTSLSLRS